MIYICDSGLSVLGQTDIFALYFGGSAMEVNREFINKIPLFQNLSLETLERLGELLEERNYAAGATVFYENSLGDFLYVIKEGSLEVVKTVDEHSEEVLTTLGPGDFFGEMGILENEPRSATVRAQSESVLLFISKNNFDRFMYESPEITLELASALSARLRQANARRISQLHQKNLELEKAYSDLKAAQEDLMQKENLASIGMVMSQLIHDIQIPMTAIRNYAKLIYKQCPESRHFADFITSEAEQMVDMTREMLDFVRGRENELELSVVSIPDLVENSLRMFEPLCRQQQVRIEKDLEYAGEVIIDRTKFRRLIANLISNACVAMPDGGVLRIRTQKTDKNIVLAFSDTGKGIPEEISDTLYEPFVSFGKILGTGLGLTIVKKVVDAHGGKIEHQSEPGRGTTFRIYLSEKSFPQY